MTQPTAADMERAHRALRQAIEQPAPDLVSMIASGRITEDNAESAIRDVAQESYLLAEARRLVQSSFPAIERMTRRAADRERKPAALAELAERAAPAFARLRSVIDRYGYDPVIGTNPAVTRAVRDEFDRAVADVRTIQEERNRWGAEGAAAFVVHARQLDAAETALRKGLPLDVLMAQGIDLKINSIAEMAAITAEGRELSEQEQLRRDPEAGAQALAEAQDRRRRRELDAWGALAGGEQS